MKKNIALLMLGFALLGSCSQSAQEQDTAAQAEQSHSNQKAEPINLSLEGTLDTDLPQDEEARAFAFNVGAGGATLKMTEESIPSVAVIANADKSILYYININWSKTSGQNHLYFKDVDISRDIFNRPINLATNQRWYIMGYLGGTFNSATRQVTYNPNGTTLNASGDQPTIKNVPVAFPWTELEVKHYGQRQLALAKERIRFRTLGMMMRLTLKNDFSSNVRIKSIKYESNALTTTSGSYNLNSNNLPTTNTTTLPRWTSSGVVEPSYTLANTSGSALNLTLAPNTTSTQSFLVWGMPVATAPANPMTHVIADVSRLSGNTVETYPKMSSLYVWGSTNMPKERSRRKISAIVEREKMALEYFGKNYVGHNGFNVANAAVAEMTTTADWGSIPLFTYAETSKVNALRAGWRVPAYKDARGLFIPNITGDDVKFIGNIVLTLRDFAIRVNGQEANYTDIYKNGPTVYALRFDGNQRKLYSAWKYSYSEATGATIESIYLGPNYKGGINEISQEAFWTKHANDIIKRSYRSSYYIINNGQDSRIGYPNFWALNETVPNLTPGARHWGIGSKDANGVAQMSHARHVDRRTRQELPSNSHIIPIEAVEATPTWHD